MSDDTEAAIEQLTNHQQQLDMHGEFVGVSRQALDELLAGYTTALRQRDEARSQTGQALEGVADWMVKAGEARAQALEDAARAANSVQLPPHYIWSDGNREKFNFGRDEAVAAIRALANDKAATPIDGER